MRKIVGARFGERPIDRLDDILDEKAKTANWIAQELDVQPSDTVLDIGAGAGLVAARMAQLCESVVCVDISANQKAFALRTALRGVDNAKYFVMQYGDFSEISKYNIRSAYSTAVFIHFNIYDIYYYLKRIADLIPEGGRFLFTFLDSNRLDPNQFDFSRHFERFEQSLNSRYLLTPHCSKFICKLAENSGFRIVSTSEAGEANTAITLERRA